jgi:tRNA-binding protein
MSTINPWIYFINNKRIIYSHYSAMPKPTITRADFEKVDIRTWTIVEVQEFPEARKPAYKLTIDFGPEIGIKHSSAQITTHYTPQTLVHKQIIAVVNFPPKQIGKFMSECLVLGVHDRDWWVFLLSPDHQVDNGTAMM